MSRGTDSAVGASATSSSGGGMRVVRPGVLTTVQDAGRRGLQHLGIVPGGAMDSLSHALANALVGNSGDEATLECTVIGPELVLQQDALVALCGARFDAKVGRLPLPPDRPVALRAGSVLAIGRAVQGTRAYLAVAGGIAVPLVLGSRSTYLPAGFGGLDGRALRAGDRVPLGDDAAAIAAERWSRIARRAIEAAGLRTVRWSAPSLTLPGAGPVTIHAMPGQHHASFDEASRTAFFAATWRVGADSNRMGYRLSGAQLARSQPADILSGPTCLGTVQVPASGSPIVLMADHQTTGGYPKVAEVAGADVPRLAQLGPGGQLRFVRCTLEQALELRRVARARLSSTIQAIQWEYER